MPSSEYLYFAEKFRTSPFDNPRRIGYARLRQLQEARITSEDAGCPGILQRRTRIGKIQAEWLIPEGCPENKAMVYIHGGGWSLGSIRQTRIFLAPMAKKIGFATVHFNYRLMPEHPFPAGMDDCYSFYLGLLEKGWQAQNLALAGESAGANLALALLLRLKEEGLPLPAAAVLMSPITFMDTMEGSHTEMADFDYILAEDSFIISDVAELYAPGRDKTHPWLSPLYGDLLGLPPMQLFVGTDELLFDDAIRFYRKSRRAGNLAELIVGDHMPHSWPIFIGDFPEAEEAVTKMADFLRLYLLKEERGPASVYEAEGKPALAYKTERKQASVYEAEQKPDAVCDRERKDRGDGDGKK